MVFVPSRFLARALRAITARQRFLLSAFPKSPET